jgi:hypothetical protein
VDGENEELMDLANVVLTVILSSIALGVGIVRGVRYTMRNILIEEGLIRPGKDSSGHWPNGWHTLPDTLEGIAGRLNDHIRVHE